MNNFRYGGAFALYLSSLVSQSCTPLTGVRDETERDLITMCVTICRTLLHPLCGHSSSHMEDWVGRRGDEGSTLCSDLGSQLLLPHRTEHLTVTADTLGASIALATVGGDTQPEVRKLFFNF